MIKSNCCVAVDSSAELKNGAGSDDRDAQIVPVNRTSSFWLQKLAHVLVLTLHKDGHSVLCGAAELVTYLEEFSVANCRLEPAPLVSEFCVC